MKPGFVALFKRGRYSRLRDDERAHQEQERFTAAAIGFCIDHDKEFAKSFWECVCRGPDHPSAANIRCMVEPERWADLVVFNKTKSRELACVVELKLDKSLSDHQNPAEPAFSAESGYGRLVMDDKTVLRNCNRQKIHWPVAAVQLAIKRTCISNRTLLTKRRTTVSPEISVKLWD